jgi:hypothetical protein
MIAGSRELARSRPAIDDKVTAAVSPDVREGEPADV